MKSISRVSAGEPAVFVFNCELEMCFPRTRG